MPRLKKMVAGNTRTNSGKFGYNQPVFRNFQRMAVAVVAVKGRDGKREVILTLCYQSHVIWWLVEWRSRNCSDE
ncbi:hypothetical protein L3X38_012120 [Prunus dulcis]|uniref:Uncharacterized protein n=1 Tax=Prunus dulcis TaxID=3755 RepID=A0AAD4ZGC1_PRUDU|nr:hypothetical protein L3X38_012120 [Prunus dulcis]